MSEPIYTIGHSTHPIETFLELLGMHGVTAVCDVRSTPYSRMNPQFNRETLLQVLRERNIEYVFLGRELGARRDEPGCYIDGQAAYERIAELPAFIEGLARLRRGMDRHVVAIMCAEKEPLDCHRTILICRHLHRCGVRIHPMLAAGGS